MSQWTKIKSILGAASKEELVKLIGELESLSKANASFLEARFLPSPDSIKRDKELIQKYVSPSEPWKKSQQVNLKEARKIISNYKKASNDTLGVIELMVHYVECGTGFSREFGDIGESYYSSMESMFDSALELMKKHSNNEVDNFIYRMKSIIQEARHSGYGYSDALSDMLKDAYPHI